MTISVIMMPLSPVCVQGFLHMIFFRLQAMKIP
jgi:hypothetical protein